MADIDATAAVVGFLVNGAGIATLRALLEREEQKKLTEQLSGAIDTTQSDFEYVQRRKKKLMIQLCTWILLLSLINLLIFAAVILFLIVGPVKIAAYVPRLQPTPLTLTAKVLLGLWLLFGIITYVALCLAPTIGLIKLSRKATKWVRAHNPIRLKI